MTFSLVARCADTNRLGVVIASSSPAVAARCSLARAGVGAVSSQNVTNPALRGIMLDRLAAGGDADDAVEAALNSDDHPDYRQLVAIGRTGRAAAHSGARVLGIANVARGSDCAAAGNLLANANVPGAMVKAFEESIGSFGDKLVAALIAGRDAGGEAGPIHSAGMLIVDVQSWPYADLRMDWCPSDCPIAAVTAAWTVYSTQADDYVARALDPKQAPPYGVPGNE